MKQYCKPQIKCAAVELSHMITTSPEMYATDESVDNSAVLTSGHRGSWDNLWGTSDE